MASSKLLKLLGDILGDEKLGELRRKAWESLGEAKNALDQTKRDLQEARQEEKESKQKEAEAQKKYKAAAVRQAPRIRKALVKEHAAEAEVATRKASFQATRAAFGAGSPQSRLAQSFYKQSIKDLEKRRRQRVKATEPVTRAGERYQESRKVSQRAARRAARLDREVGRKRIEHKESLEHLKEAHGRRGTRISRFIRGVKESREGGGTRARAIESGGPTAELASMVGQGATHIAQGMALAFGGPYGPLLKKGIGMFGGLVKAGIDAGTAMEKWSHEVTKGILSLSGRSPHMFAVAAQREMIETREDMIRGRGLAPGMQIANQIHQQTLRQSRINFLQQQAFEQRQSSRWDISQGSVDQALAQMRSSGPLGAAASAAINATRLRQVFAATIYGARAIGLVQDDKEVALKDMESKFDEAIEREKRDMALEDAGRQGRDLFQRGGYFDILGGGQTTAAGEDVRAGLMVQSWAEQMGRPDRFGQ